MSLGVKSGRPLSGEGLVGRPRPIAALDRARHLPLVTVIAPAGYGKTSLLAHWAERDPRPTVWIALEPWHDEPLSLAAEILAQINDTAPLPPAALEALHHALHAHQPDFSHSVLPALSAALEAIPNPLVLILDDAHHITSHSALRLLATLTEHLPPRSQLLLASRAPLALPLGRLRVHRALLELGPSELAMQSSEALSLLAAAGVPTESVDIPTLLQRTEGWPAGLYLAALAAREQPDPAAALARFAGDDHVVAEYLRDEFLADLPTPDFEFLRDCSILPCLSAPLCDAVLPASDSTLLLDRLAHSSLPIQPVDRSHDSYRCHPLLRDMLLGELRQLHPEHVAALHLRASLYQAQHANPDQAISHAIAAHDAPRAGELMWEHLPAYLAQGRNDLVLGWLANFSSEDLSTHAPLSLTAAYSALALGHVRQAEHWGLVGAAALARASSPSQVHSLPTAAALIEAALGRHGVTPMGLHAARAYAREDPDSPWRSICLLLQGVAEHLTGDRAHARLHLEDGIHHSSFVAPPVEMLCLSQLAMITIEEGDWDRGCDLIARAVRQIERHDLASYPASALTFAVSAEVSSHVGRVDEGKRDARRAAHLLPHAGEFIPWFETETRIMLARAALRLADVGAARTLLAQASQLARRVPDAVLFPGWLDETWGLVDSAASAALAGPSTLTMAELRILRFLPTHLTFREIGARLHVSTNTVKTQAHAVYRKLDVSSRSQAVSRAAEIGLLDT
jgi:LuxR family transcriptional regulator, maltose regulon positive regulatory protein